MSQQVEKINACTPGPWRAVPKGEIYRGWHVVTESPGLNELPVAEIWSTQFDEDKNAILIAASPILRDLVGVLVLALKSADKKDEFFIEIEHAEIVLHYIETGKWPEEHMFPKRKQRFSELLEKAFGETPADHTTAEEGEV